jgi:predicted nucleotidyltransferase
MTTLSRIPIPAEAVADFCRRHHIRKLALFGSVLRDDFTDKSDVDLLVEFEEGHVPGFITLGGMELELSEIFGGRKVDMNTRECLSRYFRDKVLASAEIVYDGP